MNSQKLIKRLNTIIKDQDKEIKRLRSVIDKYSWLIDFYDELKRKLKEQE